jgi:WD40 repeat protein
MIRVYKGHTASVTACAFSHDDRFVLSASEDQTARIWETMTGRCVAMFQAFDKLTSAQWSHQGDRIVLGGEAGIYLLQFNRNGLVEL